MYFFKQDIAYSFKVKNKNCSDPYTKIRGHRLRKLIIDYDIL